MNTHLPTVSDHQGGFGLVESLVALVVVSVGMIGIASLYGQGLSASRQALFRTHAVNLASDMADRIRLNRRAGAGYQVAGGNNNCEPGGVTCTPAQMAGHDVWMWNNQITALLPGGIGTVSYVAALPPTYTIQVSWQDPDAGLVPATLTIAVSVPDL